MANVVLNRATGTVANQELEQVKDVSWGNSVVNVIGSAVSPIVQKIVSVAQGVFQKEETKLGCQLFAGAVLFSVGLSFLFGSSSELQSAHTKISAPVKEESSDPAEAVDPEEAGLIEGANNLQQDQTSATENEATQLGKVAQDAGAVSASSKDAKADKNSVEGGKKIVTVTNSTSTQGILSSLSFRIAKKVAGIIGIVAGAVTMYDAYSRTKW